MYKPKLKYNVLMLKIIFTIYSMLCNKDFILFFRIFLLSLVTSSFNCLISIIFAEINLQCHVASGQEKKEASEEVFDLSQQILTLHLFVVAAFQYQ